MNQRIIHRGTGNVLSVNSDNETRKKKAVPTIVIGFIYYIKTEENMVGLN